MVNVEIVAMTEKNYEQYLRLWKDCFGDDRSVVEEFWENFGDEIEAFVLTENGKVIAELTRFFMGELCGKCVLEGLPVYVSYAICTDNNCRDKGYGSEITKFARELCFNDGAVSVLCPADEGLVGFYEHLGYSGIFKEELYCTDVVQSVNSENKTLVSVRRISPEEYLDKREIMLKDRLHVKLNERSMRYADMCSGEAGLLSINEGKVICACEERSNSKILYVAELLTEEGNAPQYDRAGSMMKELAEYFGREGCVYRLPAEVDSKTSRVQAMAAVGGIKETFAADIGEGAVGWFGFPFA